MNNPDKIASLVRMLLDKPELGAHYPLISTEIHKARLGQPSLAMRRVLQQLGCLDVVGTPRKRLGVGLAPLRVGATVAVMKNRASPVLPTALTDDVLCAKVTAVELYPLDPDADAHKTAGQLAGGRAFTWATIVAVVSHPDGQSVPGPLRWDYVMEHET